jgi:hypothetical protein
VVITKLTRGQRGRRWQDEGIIFVTIQVGMKTEGNGWENPSTISVSIFYYRKREWERKSQERERKRDMRVTKMGGNQNINRNALLFNHRSPRMNITLHTLLLKLFLKNIIKVTYFL